MAGSLIAYSNIKTNMNAISYEIHRPKCDE